MSISAIRGGQSQAYEPVNAGCRDPQVELEMLLLERQNQQEKEQDAAFRSGEAQMQREQADEVTHMRAAADARQNGAIVSGAFEIAGAACEALAAGGMGSKLGNAALKVSGDHLGKVGASISQATYGHQADCAQIDGKEAQNRADTARTRMQHGYDGAQRARGKEGAMQEAMHEAINRNHDARMALLRG